MAKTTSVKPGRTNAGSRRGSGTGRSPSGSGRPRSRRSPITSPRRRNGRWLIAAAVAVALLIIIVVVVAFRGGRSPSSPTAAPYVGGDLHTVAVVDDRVFLGGHERVVATSPTAPAWTRLASLDNADAMGWAVTPGAVLVGGHPGLFRSTDQTATFTRATGTAALSDVHALGAAGNTVYAGSPQSGFLTSIDGGLSWTVRNASAGRSFMGTLLVDPKNPQRVIAPDMQNGIVTSSDGGRSWHSLGGPEGAMAVAWNPRNTAQLIAVGMNGGARSSDGGGSWQPVQLPSGTTAVSYAADGNTLYAGALRDQHAYLYSSRDGADWTAFGPR